MPPQSQATVGSAGSTASPCPALSSIHHMESGLMDPYLFGGRLELPQGQGLQEAWGQPLGLAKQMTQTRKVGPWLDSPGGWLATPSLPSSSSPARLWALSCQTLIPPGKPQGRAGPGGPRCPHLERWPVGNGHRPPGRAVRPAPNVGTEVADKLPQAVTQAGCTEVRG